ncbi:spore coat protein [Oceanobacillus luteolus]|uniref:Spore coat protein n=1 Tax=Oceanobacillus luteolus TaxID=1274358 RepID=A0ABW4HPJ7_9BACI|nr:spore coat protein [Oceanobacillus luteolus]
MLQKIAGMSGMTDQVIALDFLISSKAAVRNLTFALTESVTPEVRTLLRGQLNDAIQTHKQISQYMIKKGYYHPRDFDKQLKVELKASKAALKLAK